MTALARDRPAAGKETWACFDCRAAARRPARSVEAVACPRCGGPCRNLGTRIRIPPRRLGREWRALREGIRERGLAGLARLARERARLRHRLERQVAELETRPRTPARDQAIGRLKVRLALA